MRKLIYKFLIWLINLSLKKHRKRWHDENFNFGIELGYPKCCVDAFCYDCPEALQIFNNIPEFKKDIELRYNAALIDGVYSGFIPCTNHAKQILNNEIKLHELIKNRFLLFNEFPNY